MKRLIQTDEELQHIDSSRLLDAADLRTLLNAGTSVTVRKDGEFKDQAIYLSGVYDWQLGKDSLDRIILVPLKKVNEEDE